MSQLSISWFSKTFCPQSTAKYILDSNPQQTTTAQRKWARKQWSVEKHIAKYVSSPSYKYNYYKVENQKKMLPIVTFEEYLEKQEKQSDKIKKQIETQQKIEMLKTHIELLFKFLMALLIIYIFNPRENRLYLINYEAKVLFFLFGIILIFTANWKQIFKESPLVIYIQNVLHP
jgi:hypothetical protein